VYVWGQTNGKSPGVFGQATADGMGVEGLSDSGTGVRAESTSGTALQVAGTAAWFESTPPHQCFRRSEAMW
jgi:hypothetical protein